MRACVKTYPCLYKKEGLGLPRDGAHVAEHGLVRLQHLPAGIRDKKDGGDRDLSRRGEVGIDSKVHAHKGKRNLTYSNSPSFRRRVTTFSSALKHLCVVGWVLLMCVGIARVSM
jgi:hypothetical protein